MKKIIIAMSAVAMILGAYSCKNDNAEKKSDGTTEQTVTEVKTPAQLNAEAGIAFMENLKATDPDVKFTPNGLGYKVVKEGKGEKPTATSTVKVDYTGTHINGEQFDSSMGNAIEFPLNRVIAGFSEGLQLMSPGAEYILYIPGEMAYGPQGAGDLIGPNETLIFNITLISFK